MNARFALGVAVLGLWGCTYNVPGPSQSPDHPASTQAAEAPVEARSSVLALPPSATQPATAPAGDASGGRP